MKTDHERAIRRALLADLAMSRGWQKLADEIANELIASRVRQLTVTKFADLHAVGLLQGEIRAYEDVLRRVNTCLKEHQKGKGE